MDFIEKAYSYLREDRIEECLRLTFRMLDQIIERKKKEASIENSFDLDLINLKDINHNLTLISSRVFRAEKAIQRGTLDYATKAIERSSAIEGILNNLEQIDAHRNGAESSQEKYLEIKDLQALETQLDQLISLL